METETGKHNEIPQELEDSESDRKFFNSITRALAAVCIAQTEKADSLPLHMTPYDIVFSVLGSADTANKQNEIIQSPEFPKMYNKFVKNVKIGVKKGNK